MKLLNNLITLDVNGGGLDWTSIFVGIIALVATILATFITVTGSRKAQREKLEHEARMERLQAEKRDAASKKQMHDEIQRTLQELRDTIREERHANDIKFLEIANSIARINERLKEE